MDLDPIQNCGSGSGRPFNYGSTMPGSKTLPASMKDFQTPGKAFSFQRRT
jgi:hypothetical protein